MWSMKLAAATFAFAFATLPAGALAQSPPAPVAAESTLAVSGDATVERDPDVARVSAEIVTNDDVAARSAGKNAAVFETLKTKLAALGIARDSIRTTYFNVNFVPRPNRTQPGDVPQRYGYVTSRSLGIAVMPIEQAGKIVDASLAAGVTQVGSVRFELKDRKVAYREALARAFAAARASAAALVASSDVRLGRVRDIRADDYAMPPRAYDGVTMRSAAMQAPLPPTQIDPGGPVAVTAHVTVTYIVRPN
ncbi:MAG: hypothetical protein NVSMB19_05100 [Vulcanimicrobiaceae bacterium]